MNRLKSIIYMAVIFAALAAACPAGASTGEEKPPLTVSDVVGRETVSGFVLAPGGGWAAWVKTSADSALDSRMKKLIVMNLEDGYSFSLEEKKGDSYSPDFSPDGSLLGFLRKKKGKKAAIYVYDLKGGDPRKVAGTESGVNGFKWAGEREILFTSREDSTYRERELKKEKDNTIIVADQRHYPPVRLFLAEVESGKITRVTGNSGRITEFAISHDGRRVVLNVNVDVNYQYDHRTPPRQYLLNLEAFRKEEGPAAERRRGESAEPEAGYAVLKEIFTKPHVNPSGFVWSPDSEGFYCSRAVSSDSTDTYVGIRKLYHYTVSSATLRKTGVSDSLGLGGDYFAHEDGALVTLASGTDFRVVFHRTSGRGDEEYRIEAEDAMTMVPRALDPGSGRLIYTVSDASSPVRIMTGKLKRGKLRDREELFEVNSAYRKKFLARSKIVSWKGALDETVEGVLYYPAGFEEGARFPLVVSLHGGPSGTDLDYFSERWSNYPHLLASRGAFVLKVNYHGSGNYGLRWVESIKGHYYEYEVPDILAGVDHLVGLGYADRDKTGIMGWSNGSILAIKCCIESDRFKALCAGAGDVNWTSDYGNCSFGAVFDNAYFGGPPWEKQKTYVEKSPLFDMERLQTPTLIMFGSKDRSVPTEQGWEHFRAMQQIGNAPVRFILFPGAGHGPDKLSHQRRKMREELAWFDKYLFEKEKEENEVLDPGSPLASELVKLKAEREGTLFGEVFQGTLIPETIKMKGFAAGRFEVTRAQFAEFDPDCKFPAGTGNYPAGGVSLEKAREYCGWLSEKTGRSFRLPSREEMDSVISLASPDRFGENNLSYWAGYVPAPCEVAPLMSEIEMVKSRRLLIMEVGSFPPASGFFDLAGNVSEWVETPEGGRPEGLSAVMNPDKRVPGGRFFPDYTGFRIWEDIE